MQEFKPVAEVRRSLEQMLSPKQAMQAQSIYSLEQLADLVRVNFSMQRQEIDQTNEEKLRAKMEHE